MNTLNNELKKQLIKQSHALHPVVIIGSKGLTEAVHKEIDIALNAHELIKIKVAGAERDARQACLMEIAARHQADIVQIIGHVGILYRKNVD